MPARKSSATQRKSFETHWAAIGDLIAEAVFGGSSTSEPIESIVDTKGKAIPKAAKAPTYRGFATAGGVRKHVEPGTKGHGHDVVYGAEGTQGMDYDEARRLALGGYCKTCKQ